jgi:hypothetical protein
MRGDVGGSRVKYSPGRSPKYAPFTPGVSLPGRTPGAGKHSGRHFAPGNGDEADVADGTGDEEDGDRESEHATVAAVREAVGADVSEALARSQIRESEPMSLKSPLHPKSPLHADDSTLSAGSSVVRSTHWPPANSPRRPGSVLVSPRQPGPSAFKSPRQPGALLVSPNSAPPQAMRRMPSSSSPRTVGNFAHSPSVASARSLRGGAEGEPSAFYTSPRAATYGPMPWDAGETWARDPNWPPSERLKDRTPRTTAEALASVGTGSYATAQHRHAQARSDHEARWEFGPIESHLHVTPVGVERRMERRARDLLGNKLSASSTPRTPKQWIALDDNLAVRR